MAAGSRPAPLYCATDGVQEVGRQGGGGFGLGELPLMVHHRRRGGRPDLVSAMYQSRTQPLTRNFLLWVQGRGFKSPSPTVRAVDRRLEHPMVRRYRRRNCGCSSMAEFQPSKLAMRVRSPSPAPSKIPGQRHIPATCPGEVRSLESRRELTVTLRFGLWRAVVGALVRDQPGDAVGDGAVAALGRILVAQRGLRR